MVEERSSLIPRRNHSYGSVTPQDDANETGNSYSQQPSISNASQSATTDGSATDQARTSLSAMNKLGFGFGHIYNDLCAGVWFSYTLLFMKGALLLPEAGIYVFLGQVGDAIATPIVGLLADRYGTKQKWHIFGNRHSNNRNRRHE